MTLGVVVVVVGASVVVVVGASVVVVVEGVTEVAPLDVAGAEVDVDVEVVDVEDDVEVEVLEAGEVNAALEALAEPLEPGCS